MRGIEIRYARFVHCILVCFCFFDDKKDEQTDELIRVVLANEAYKHEPIIFRDSFVLFVFAGDSNFDPLGKVLE